MYEKRLCILKQVKRGFSADGAALTGAVYAERIGSELIITPKIAGLTPLKEGRYALSIWIRGKLFCLELKGASPLRIPDCPSLCDGFAALLCLVRLSGTEAIAHGFCGSAPCEMDLLLSVFSQKNRTSFVAPPESDLVRMDSLDSDPKKVRNENSALREQNREINRSKGLEEFEIKKNLEDLGEVNPEKLKKKVEEPIKKILDNFKEMDLASNEVDLKENEGEKFESEGEDLKENEGEKFELEEGNHKNSEGEEIEGWEEFEKTDRIAAEGAYDDEAIASTDYFSKSFESAEESTGHEAESGQESGGGEEENSELSCNPFRLVRGGLTYYHKIAGKLAVAMKKFPRDERLKAIFPHSEWVKAEGGLLGVIYAEGLPRYLCVAMEEEPPEEVRSASVFVPKNAFTDSEGYYIVFQDAETGDYVKVENI